MGHRGSDGVHCSVTCAAVAVFLHERCFRFCLSVLTCRSAAVNQARASASVANRSAPHHTTGKLQHRPAALVNGRRSPALRQARACTLFVSACVSVCGPISRLAESIRTVAGGASAAAAQRKLRTSEGQETSFRVSVGFTGESGRPPFSYLCSALLGDRGTLTSQLPTVTPAGHIY